MIESKIKQIVIENIEEGRATEDIEPHSRLAEIGVNSIVFIKIIVAIETEFGFEFDDQDLDYNKFPNIESLVTYVKNKLMIINNFDTMMTSE